MAKLLKSSLLFSYGETEKAETLFNETQKQNLNITCSGLADAILTIDILIIAKTIKLKSATILEKIITILLFVVVKFIGITQDKNGWKNFIDCFMWKLNN